MKSFKQYLKEMDLAAGLRSSGVGGTGKVHDAMHWQDIKSKISKGISKGVNKIGAVKKVRGWSNRYHKPELDKTPSAPRSSSGSFLKLRPDKSTDTNVHQRSDIGPPDVNKPRELHDTGPSSSVQAKKLSPKTNVPAKPMKKPVTSKPKGDKIKGSITVKTSPLKDTSKARHSSPLGKPIKG